MKKLHEFLHEKRLEREITLRQFCRDLEVDPSNWSKIERGIAPAPKSKEFRERIAEVLALNTEEIATLNDLATIEFIPEDLRPEEKILEKLPIFFRTGRGEKPSKKELEELLKALSNG